MACLSVAILGLLFLPDRRPGAAVEPEDTKENLRATSSGPPEAEKRARVRRVGTDSLGGQTGGGDHCSVRKCPVVLCSGVSAELGPGQVASEFIKSRFKVACEEAESVQLTFENCKFPSNELRENSLPTDVLVDELTFTGCSLAGIADDAFSRPIYERTAKLSIIENKILSLRRATFRHLPNLRQLVIRNSPVERAELNLLDGVSGSLGTLELENAIKNTETLRNITGGSALPNLQILSVSRNSIPVIDKTIFAGLPRVVSLYVENSKVRTIEPGAFDAMSRTLQLLTINDNDVSSLPEALFDKILSSGQLFRTVLRNNPWHCDCKLKWLQDLIREDPGVANQGTTCASPEPNHGKPFSKANFCNDTGSTTTEEPPETTEPNGIINVSCSSIGIRLTRTSSRLLSTLEFKLQPRFPGFSAREVENGFVLVSLPDLSTGIRLVWFDTNNPESSIRCAGDIKHSYLLRNLRRQRSYTVCLLQAAETTVSPLNCLAVVTSPAAEDRAWLTNADKPVVLSLSSAFLIALPILSGICVFIFVRRHPSLLRGSKRVVMVKRRTNVDAIVLPKGLQLKEQCRNNEPAPPLLPNDAHVDGYVTPLPPVHTARKSSRGSVASLQSDEISYVSEVEPTVAQLAAWRLKRLKSQSENERVTLPPLPPRPANRIPSLSSRVDSGTDAGCDYASDTV